MTTAELKSALRETTRDDRAHQEQVEKLIKENDDHGELKKQIKKMLEE